MRGHGCSICCPGSGFLGPQSIGAIVATVHSLALLCGAIAPVQAPIRSRNTAGPPSNFPIAAMSAFLHPLGPGSAVSIRFTNFAGGSVNFAAACLTAAHCILIRRISCSSESTATSERTSVAVCLFCGARAPVCKICSAARMLQETILSEAHVVFAFSVVLCCRVCVCRHLARRSPMKARLARTSTKFPSTHSFLPTLHACPPTPCSTFASYLASALFHLHIRCLHKPAAAALDQAKPIKLQQSQPGGTLNHGAWSIDDGNTCDVATAS